MRTQPRIYPPVFSNGKSMRVMHFGQAALVEIEPIQIAKIPVKGEDYQNCAFVHPRYAPKTLPHEIIEVRGFRRGRTLDILLDEPIEFHGKKYGILNVKGAGADKVNKQYNFRDMVLDPTEDAQAKRKWGMVKIGAGQEEFYCRILARAGIPHIYYTSMISVPLEVEEKVVQIHGGERQGAVQLQRLCQTNVRMDLLELYIHDIENDVAQVEEERKIMWMEWSDHIETRKIAIADAAFISAQIKLALRDQGIDSNGGFIDNRFIDGCFTDSENYYKTRLMFGSSAIFLSNLIEHSYRFLAPELRELYMAVLKENTGIDFTEFFGIEDIDEKNRVLDRVLKEKIRGLDNKGKPNKKQKFHLKSIVRFGGIEFSISTIELQCSIDLGYSHETKIFAGSSFEEVYGYTYHNEKQAKRGHARIMQGIRERGIGYLRSICSDKLANAA